MDHVSAEILTMIFKLIPKSAPVCGRVCRNWYSVCRMLNLTKITLNNLVNYNLLRYALDTSPLAINFLNYIIKQNPRNMPKILRNGILSDITMKIIIENGNSSSFGISTLRKTFAKIDYYAVFKSFNKDHFYTAGKYGNKPLIKWMCNLLSMSNNYKYNLALGAIEGGHLHILNCKKCIHYLREFIADNKNGPVWPTTHMINYGQLELLKAFNGFYKYHPQDVKLAASLGKISILKWFISLFPHNPEYFNNETLLAAIRGGNPRTAEFIGKLATVDMHKCAKIHMVEAAIDPKNGNNTDTIISLLTWINPDEITCAHFAIIVAGPEFPQNSQIAKIRKWFVNRIRPEVCRVFGINNEKRQREIPE